MSELKASDEQIMLEFEKSMILEEKEQSKKEGEMETMLNELNAKLSKLMEMEKRKTYKKERFRKV